MSAISGSSVVGQLPGVRPRRGRGPRTAGQRRRRSSGGTAHTVSPGHAQRFATGGHEPQARAAAQQIFGHGGGRVDDVLAVVEHDDHLAVADHVGEPGGVGYVERGRDRRGHRDRITDRRELDEVAAVGERDRFGARHLQREPRLADTARTDEGQKPLLGGEAGELAQLVVASDERRQRFRDGASPLDFGGA